MTDSLLSNNNLPQDNDLDDNKDWYSELVGDGKKYADNKALAKAATFKDRHINLLEREGKELRDELLKFKETDTTRASLQDLIKELQQQRQLSNNQPPVNTDTQPSSLKQEDVLSLWDQRYEQTRQREREQDNLNTVHQLLVERHGPNYQGTLNKQISELGLSNIDDMAKRNPKLVIRALGLDQPVQTENFQAPPRGPSDFFRPTSSQDKPWSYWQKEKKDKGLEWYLSKDTQHAMATEMARLGNKFEDGDFNLLR